MDRGGVVVGDSVVAFDDGGEVGASVGAGGAVVANGGGVSGAAVVSNGGPTEGGEFFRRTTSATITITSI